MKKSIAILLSIFLFSSSFGQSEWKKEKEKDGITIYTRTSGGKDLKEFKAYMTLEARMSTVTAILTQASNYPNWVYKLSSTKKLKGNVPQGSWTYYTVSMPWPLTDRDGISATTASQKSDGTVIIKQKSAPSFVPEKEDFVRLAQVDTEWKIEQLPEGKLKISYQSLADPGALPAWLVNLFLLDGPFETMKGLRKECKKESFIYANVPWIKN
ncbi:MAG: START domain-containing protein [Bacteroidia bacterium]|nr:START domain-containing protein [Bacteroidia bacterium]